MKIFVDTANVDYIREVNDMGVICGVTRLGKNMKLGRKILLML